MIDEGRSAVPALDRAARILGLISSRRSCSVQDLLSGTGISRTTLYALLGALQKAAFIRKRGDGRYVLWTALAILGAQARANIDLKGIAAPVLEELVKSSGCLSCYFGVMDGARACYAVKASNPNGAIMAKSGEGMDVDLVHSGMGKCLLAFCGEDLRERLLPALDYARITRNSVAGESELRAQLEAFRRQGFAFNDSEDDVEIRSLAVPAFTSGGTLIGAVSAVGTVNQFNGRKASELVPLMRKAAQEISSAIEPFIK